MTLRDRSKLRLMDQCLPPCRRAWTTRNPAQYFHGSEGMVLREPKAPFHWFYNHNDDVLTVHHVQLAKDYLCYRLDLTARIKREVMEGMSEKLCQSSDENITKSGQKADSLRDCMRDVWFFLSHDLSEFLRELIAEAFELSLSEDDPYGLGSFRDMGLPLTLKLVGACREKFSPKLLHEGQALLVDVFWEEVAGALSKYGSHQCNWKTIIHSDDLRHLIELIIPGDRKNRAKANSRVFRFRTLLDDWRCVELNVDETSHKLSSKIGLSFGHFMCRDHQRLRDLYLQSRINRSFDSESPRHACPLSSGKRIDRMYTFFRIADALGKYLTEDLGSWRTLEWDSGNDIWDHLAEHAKVPFFVKDQFMRYVLINSAMCKLMGYSEPSEMLWRSGDAFEKTSVARQIDELCWSGLLGVKLFASSDMLPEAWNGNTLSLIPIKAQGGSVTGVLGILFPDEDPVDLVDDDVRERAEYPCEAMRRVLEEAKTIAATETTVLLLGESGTGKDRLARYIHDHSGKPSSSFLAINCATIPVHLAESVLFGHERGAFTGANELKPGIFEQVKGGTLLLNEIGELPLEVQSKLLDVLETKQFRRLGGKHETEASFRLIAATNRDLFEETKDGRFRQDLYYRLNVCSIVLPPLRKRMPEIPVLAKELMTNVAKKLGFGFDLQLSASTLKALQTLSWPGNVRELRNLLERALVLSGNDSARMNAYLDQQIAMASGSGLTTRFDSVNDSFESASEEDMVDHGPPGAGKHLRLELDEDQFRRMVREVFREGPTQVSLVAEILGWSRKTVQDRLNRLGLPGAKSGRPRIGEKPTHRTRMKAWLDREGFKFARSD
jgi:DNA-binding NtrC family response regulator